MSAEECEARRWFRARLQEIGKQYPELKTPAQQARLEAELQRQEQEDTSDGEER